MHQKQSVCWSTPGPDGEAYNPTAYPLAGFGEGTPDRERTQRKVSGEWKKRKKGDKKKLHIGTFFLLLALRERERELAPNSELFR